MPLVDPSHLTFSTVFRFKFLLSVCNEYPITLKIYIIENFNFQHFMWLPNCNIVFALIIFFSHHVASLHSSPDLDSYKANLCADM